MVKKRTEKTEEKEKGAEAEPDKEKSQNNTVSV